MKISFNKDNFIFYFFIVFLFAIIYYTINIFSYFDATSMCYIGIQGDIMRGNEKTIRGAIKIMKKDRSAYHDMCKYVDTIKEDYCQIADWYTKMDKYQKGLDLDGCYVRGSKTIYLRPDQNNNNDIILKRTETIKKMTGFSKEFWEKKNK
jgi:hypothetical protein